MLILVVLAGILLGPQDTLPRADKMAAGTVDAKLHADSVELVDLSGARKKVQDSWPKGVADGRKKMMEQCPACKPEFGEEWAKRMRGRLAVNDFLAVYVEEYEKYLTDAEVLELIRLQRAMNDGHPIPPSDALKEKLSKVMPSLLGDVVGRCSQIGAKLGAEVAGEIAKEHPDWAGMQGTPTTKP